MKLPQIILALTLLSLPSLIQAQSNTTVFPTFVKIGHKIADSTVKISDNVNSTAIIIEKALEELKGIRVIAEEVKEVSEKVTSIGYITAVVAVVSLTAVIVGIITHRSCLWLEAKGKAKWDEWYPSDAPPSPENNDQELGGVPPN